MARRRYKMKLGGPKTALVVSGALGGAFIGGLAQTPDTMQAVKFGAAGALVGGSIGAIAVALTHKRCAMYGLIGGLGLVGGGWLAARTRTEILTGGGLAGLGVGPRVQYWPPIPG